MAVANLLKAFSGWWEVMGGVCVVLCVCVSLIFPKNLAEMLIVFLLLDRKSILAKD